MTHRPNCLAPIACLAKQPDGHCRRCTMTALNHDTRLTAKRVAGLKKVMAQPEYKEKHRACVRAGIAREMANGGHERRRQQGLLHSAKHLNTPEAMARNHTPEIEAKRGKAISETKMAWCPPAYRDMYRQICRSTGMRKEEAAPMVLEQAEHDANEGSRLVAHHTQKMLDNEARRRAQEY